MRGLLLYAEAGIWQSGYLSHVVSALCVLVVFFLGGGGSWLYLGELGVWWQVQLIETHICSEKGTAGV